MFAIATTKRLRAFTLMFAAALMCVAACAGQASAKTPHSSTEQLNVKWLAPSSGHTISGFLSGSSCKISVQNSVRIKRVIFYLDDARLSTTQAPPPYSCQVNAAALSSGTHVLKAQVFTTDGDVSSAYSYVTIPWQGDPGTTVTLQGDSLTEGSWWRMPEDLGSRFDLVSLSAKIGRPSATGLSLLRHQRLGKVVVFALGTNDWWSTPQSYRQHIQKVMRLVGPSRCVVMATIWHAGHPLGWANKVLTSLAKTYGPKRFQLAQWAATVAAGDVILGDGTHPANQYGWAVRARVVSGAIQQCAAAQAS
jgi:hypothetical protein